MTLGVRQILIAALAAGETREDGGVDDGRALQRLARQLAASPHGDIDRLRAQEALARWMPELLPIHEMVVEAVAGDETVARALTGYGLGPRDFCQGVALAAGQEPLLARTFDQHPEGLDGRLVRSEWHGETVIAMTDLVWGALDGMNLAGLAVAMLYPSRRAFGLGFDPALVSRYLLETCGDVTSAVAALERVPLSETADFMLVDGAGDYRLVHMVPGEKPSVVKSRFISNHGVSSDFLSPRKNKEASKEIWEDVGLETLVEAFVNQGHLGEPGISTLYSIFYRPASGRLELRWPDFSWHQSFFAFDQGSQTIELDIAAKP